MYIKEVEELMKKSRGCELPGTFNPLIIGELFTEQCQPWRGIVVRAKGSIVQAAYDTTRTILEHVTTDETVDGIFRLINDGIEGLKTRLDQKVTELLDPHYQRHPITYNHYLTDNVQKAQADRRSRSIEKALKDIFGISRIEIETPYHISPLKLLKVLDQRTEVDMERYASDIAVDYMEAYYKVSTHYIFAFQCRVSSFLKTINQV